MFFVVLNCGKIYITEFTIVAIYNVYSSVALSTFMLLCDYRDGSCFNQVKIVDASSLFTKYMYKKIISMLCLMSLWFLSWDLLPFHMEVDLVG